MSFNILYSYKKINVLILYYYKKINVLSCLIIIFLLVSGCGNLQQQSIPIAGGSISLIVPADLEVYEIDGRSIQTPSLNDGHYELLLTAGPHSLAVQYVANWNENSDGASTAGQIVKWQPVVFNVEFLEKGSYSLQYTQPSAYESALSMRQKPVINLYHNQTLLAKGNIIDTPSLMDSLLSGRFRYGAPSTQNPSYNTRAINQSTSTQNIKPQQPSPLHQLKHWWQQASDTEKSEFWLWLNPNKN